MKKMRLRFPPSPTGNIQLGNGRTALFNWLFARHHGAEFVLRIEDTDKERSKPEFEEKIYEGLTWLGIDWDNKGSVPRQSERMEIYKKYLLQLLKEKKAYYCFCSPDDLEAERNAQMAQGVPPKYSGRCSHLSDAEVAEKLKTERAVIRLVMPERRIEFTDLIHGKLSFDGSLFGDIIIAKGLEEPLYNFAVVVDDYEMEITHVIRGDDHTSNTPKQIVIQDALGFPHVEYGHLPLILGPDRKKLSKRFMEGPLFAYKDLGYLPEAMMNFLVLLGWHPEKDREVLSIQEMISEFDITRVQKSGAIFNTEKLDWLNAHYIKSMSMEEFTRVIAPFIPDLWKGNPDRVKRILALEKDRLKKLSEIVDHAEFLFELKEYHSDLLIWKKTSLEDVKKNLELSLELLSKYSGIFDAKSIQDIFGPLGTERGRGEVFWPLRVALSGKEMSPSPFEILEVLGRDESLERIKKAIQKLTHEK